MNSGNHFWFRDGGVHTLQRSLASSWESPQSAGSRSSSPQSLPSPPDAHGTNPDCCKPESRTETMTHFVTCRLQMQNVNRGLKIKETKRFRKKIFHILYRYCVTSWPFFFFFICLCYAHCVQQASRRFSIAERFLWDTLLLSETHCNALFWCEESTLQCSTAMTPSLSVLCTVSHITAKKKKSHLQVENVCKAEIYVWHYGDKGRAGGRLCFQDTHFHMKWQPLVFFPPPMRMGSGQMRAWAHLYC